MYVFKISNIKHLPGVQEQARGRSYRDSASLYIRARGFLYNQLQRSEDISSHLLTALLLCHPLCSANGFIISQTNRHK